MARVKLRLSFVKSVMMIGSTRIAVLYDTSAVSDAIQSVIQRYCGTRMIQQYEQDTAVLEPLRNCALTNASRFNSPADWGPKNFVDVRVTTNLHCEIPLEGPR